MAILVVPPCQTDIAYILYADRTISKELRSIEEGTIELEYAFCTDTIGEQELRLLIEALRTSGLPLTSPSS